MAGSAIVQHVINDTLKEVQKSAPMSYEKMSSDPAKWDAFNQAISDAASEEVRLAEEIRGSHKPRDATQWLARSLSKERMEMIREGLKIPTFQMNVSQSIDGKFDVKITTVGNWFLTSRELESSVEVDWAANLQYASILVEAVLLSLSAVGIALTPTKTATDTAVDDAAHAIQTCSKLQQVIIEFTDAWKEAGSNAYHRAKALFFLIEHAHRHGHLWSIIKSLCKDMPWYDWLETAAKVTAMVIAALNTEGAALIAKIALAVLSAAKFNHKVENMINLFEIKQELESQ